jgi:hypothetical protein
MIGLSQLGVSAPLWYLAAFWIPLLDAIVPILPSEAAVIALGVTTSGSADPRIAVGSNRDLWSRGVSAQDLHRRHCVRRRYLGESPATSSVALRAAQLAHLAEPADVIPTG